MFHVEQIGRNRKAVFHVEHRFFLSAELDQQYADVGR